MSRAPRTTASTTSLDGYQTAWQATSQLLREGHSFSGHERNCVFLNCKEPRWANVSAVSGLDFPDDGRGLAVTDWDHDGDLDIWFSNRTGPRLRLMRNQTISSGTPTVANFVAFRLRGTISNRDAVGARVEVTLKDQSAGRLIQTLYAGDAYLSQSSKWLHFGLGEHARIQNVTVRWPTGRAERFEGIAAGRRYRLIEGSGKAVEIALSRSGLKLAPSAQSTLEPTLPGRVFLSNRLPMPILSYTPQRESISQPIETGRRPRIVILWASWCESCVAELHNLRNHATELNDVELDVIALSLDGLDENKGTEPSQARLLLDEIDFPFPAAAATREMLDKIEVVQRIVFNRQTPLSVPISFLLDANGEIAVIYRGRIHVRQLLDDMDRLDVQLPPRRDLAVPMKGRWSSSPRNLALDAVARVFRQRGHFDDYVRYARMDLDFVQRHRDRLASAERQAELDEQISQAAFDLGMSLASSGKPQQAIDYFRRAIAADVDHVEAHVNLGALLAKNKQLDTAIDVLQQAVQLDPNSAAARINLGAALGSRGELDQAIEHYKHVLRMQPNARAHAQLGALLVAHGQFEKAAGHLEQAIRLRPTDVRSMLGLAWLRATCPLDAVRDGNQAVQLAKRLENLSGGKDARVLDVLAAAQAEHGDFLAARQTLARALKQLPSGKGSEALKSAMDNRLRKYNKGKPHRDTDGKH